MDDQNALVDLTPEQVHDAQRQVRATVLAAVTAEQNRIIGALGFVINERRLSDYINEATALLVAVIPEFNPGNWYDSDGREVTGSTCDPYGCCGYCTDCETCHGDGRDEVCDMRHCHECDHQCDR